MPFRIGPCLHKYAHLLSAEPQKLTVLRHLALHVALGTSHQVGWLLDELLARDWRSTPMRGPLFIVGHQRSGTTYLQRLLASDRDQFRTLTLLDIMLPNVVPQRIAGALLRVLVGEDAVRREGLGEAVHRAENRLFGRIRAMHELRFQAPAEDEFVLWSIFASLTCLNDSPRSATMPDPYHLGDFAQWTAKERASAIGWYEACLRKKLHREPGPAASGPLWMVSKNPAFSHKMLELHASFPDARFVYLVRSPLETIPSRLSLIREIWRTRFSRFREMSPEQVRAILHDSYRTYRAAEEQMGRLPQGRVLVVPYAELRESPGRVLALLHERLGLPLHVDARAELARDGQSGPPGPRPHVSRHRYTLDEFGLREEELRAELGPIFERYGF